MKHSAVPPKYLLRTRFARDIVCEFLPPPRLSGKAIILCGGMPAYPGGKTELAHFLARKGYWTFIPRYRGTWESGGSFLALSPDRDVLDVAAGISRGFKDLSSGKTYRIARVEIYVIGSSFGGAAAILASRDRRIRKAIALSPVTDWRAGSRTEPLAWLAQFTQTAFGAAYRGSPRAWEKLKTGKFFNPAQEAASIDGKKLLIVHPADDRIIDIKLSKKFAKAAKAAITMLKRGGHLGLSTITKPVIWKNIEKFLQ